MNLNSSRRCCVLCFTFTLSYMWQRLISPTDKYASSWLNAYADDVGAFSNQLVHSLSYSCLWKKMNNQKWRQNNYTCVAKQLCFQLKYSYIRPGLSLVCLSTPARFSQSPFQLKLPISIQQWLSWVMEYW